MSRVRRVRQPVSNTVEATVYKPSFAAYGDACNYNELRQKKRTHMYRCCVYFFPSFECKCWPFVESTVEIIFSRLCQVFFLIIIIIIKMTKEYPCVRYRHEFTIVRQNLLYLTTATWRLRHHKYSCAR